MTDTEYSREQLLQVFEQVCNKRNWKNPINKVVPLDSDRDLIYEAIVYFAGCSPQFKVENDKLRIVAEGYYNAVGA